MDVFSPETLQTILETGGAPVAILLAAKYLWNGTGRVIKDIKDSNNAIVASNKAIVKEMRLLNKRLAGLDRHIQE